jgi:hypothetical protein
MTPVGAKAMVEKTIAREVVCFDAIDGKALRPSEASS